MTDSTTKKATALVLVGHGAPAENTPRAMVARALHGYESS